MAKRVTQEEVRDIVPNSTEINMEPFIEVANAITDKVSSNDTNGVMNSALLKNLELWLAAHFYAIRDQQYSSKSTGASSGQFQGNTDMGLDHTSWGQQAKLLDLTGFLNKLGKGVASGTWLGKPVSEQTDYEDRN
jgi:hypothetical protein